MSKKSTNHRYFMLAILFLMTMALALSVSAAEKVVFLTDDSFGDGSSAEKPLGTLEDAYAALGDEGGRIVLVGTVTRKENFVEPVHSGTVTLTQEHDGISYRTEENSGLLLYEIRYALNGPTTFEHMNIRGKGEDCLLIAQFHPIKIGEGVECIGFGDYSSISQGATILGGVQDHTDRYDSVTMDLDSHIEIHSGKFHVVSFSRQCKHTYAGTAHIDLYGGTFYNIFLGSVNAGTGGSVELNIYGGNFKGHIYGSSIQANKVDGNITVTVSGGDFSQFISMDGSIVSDRFTSVLDLTRYGGSSLVARSNNFSKVLTVKGEVSSKKAADVFLSGSFTSADGVTLPYRYYLPEDYETSDKTYPVFLYMHGASSIGADNNKHLTSAGAALVNQVLNSEYDCIILAPQCSTWWTQYPGSSVFADLMQNESQPQGELHAAAELLNLFLREYRADTSRVYVNGSSLGGGATWALVAWYPEVFAAAVPFAGTGAIGGAEAIASRYVNTPIWTFHGDVDTTLPAEGTRQLVTAIQAAGGNVIYTEMAGYGHNIWPAAAATEGLVDWIFAQVNDDFVNTLPEVSAPLQPAVTSAALVETTPAAVETTTVPETTAVFETTAVTTSVLTVTTAPQADTAEEVGDTPVILILCITIAVALAVTAGIVICRKKRI